MRTLASDERAWKIRESFCTSEVCGIRVVSPVRARASAVLCRPSIHLVIANILMHIATPVKCESAASRALRTTSGQ